MHATLHRDEGVDAERSDGLSREAGDAVVRDLLAFEGFRSHERWGMTRAEWSSPG